MMQTLPAVPLVSVYTHWIPFLTRKSGLGTAKEKFAVYIVYYPP